MLFWIHTKVRTLKLKESSLQCGVIFTTEKFLKVHEVSETSKSFPSKYHSVSTLELSRIYIPEIRRETLQRNNAEFFRSNVLVNKLQSEAGNFTFYKNLEAQYCLNVLGNLWLQSLNEVTELSNFHWQIFLRRSR